MVNSFLVVKGCGSVTGRTLRFTHAAAAQVRVLTLHVADLPSRLPFSETELGLAAAGAGTYQGPVSSRHAEMCQHSGLVVAPRILQRFTVDRLSGLQRGIKNTVRASSAAASRPTTIHQGPPTNIATGTDARTLSTLPPSVSGASAERPKACRTTPT